MSLSSQLSSLLFVSTKPLSLDKLSELTKSSVEEIKVVLADLQKQYSEQGLAILQVGKSYQMTTAPEQAELVKELIQDEQTGELTRPSLETLAIVAYRGPVTRAEVEQIRGVNCAVILRNLLIRGLVEAKDDEEKLATVYSITFDFLKLLGVTKAEELPDFEKLNSEENLQQVLAGQMEVIETAAMKSESVPVVAKAAVVASVDGAAGEEKEDEFDDEDDDEEDDEDDAYVPEDEEEAGKKKEAAKKDHGIILSVDEDEDAEVEEEMEEAGFHTEEEKEE